MRRGQGQSGKRAHALRIDRHERDVGKILRRRRGRARGAETHAVRHRRAAGAAPGPPYRSRAPPPLRWLLRGRAPGRSLARADASVEPPRRPRRFGRSAAALEAGPGDRNRDARLEPVTSARCMARPWRAGVGSPRGQTGNRRIGRAAPRAGDGREPRHRARDRRGAGARTASRSSLNYRSNDEAAKQARRRDRARPAARARSCPSTSPTGRRRAPRSRPTSRRAAPTTASSATPARTPTRRSRRSCRRRLGRRAPHQPRRLLQRAAAARDADGARAPTAAASSRSRASRASPAIAAR